MMLQKFIWKLPVKNSAKAPFADMATSVDLQRSLSSEMLTSKQKIISGMHFLKAHPFFLFPFTKSNSSIAAEREYIDYLREAGTKWNFCQSSVASHNLSNMMIFYKVAHGAVLSGALTDSAHRKMQECCKTLVALLAIARLQRKRQSSLPINKSSV